MAMEWLAHEQYLDHAADHARRTAELAADADMAARVPSCPDWVLRDLLFHQGMVFRWIGEVVARKATERVPFREVPDREMPEGGEADWLRAGADRTVALLRETGPDLAVWGWAHGGGTRWWARRIAHESLVHRIDAELTVGVRPEADAALAADNVDELLTNASDFDARAFAGRSALAGDGDSLHLHCTDVPGEWRLRRTAEAFTLEYGHAKADAAVRGSARDVMLWLNGRLPQGEAGPERFGEERVPELWRAGLSLT
ncbi:maleylpyruvate isomerase N-terminal domain-containing protein [Streptacidiphilus neutrinimicus]|uniref:maleylpyruvate isomerase N-terminal domain-containing protein n=1 Tax=Streptacidiphilus neutrinimicus TaxID=105420 RepID=UPI000A00D539|nr:maleylpyruvate isomerase family mycothiol-dependent enzyme [Streptacidiphilus neutrinimicus]